ncbi:MAG: hypothetical protein U0941_22035 [Planctomycetaceae bacterium]
MLHGMRYSFVFLALAAGLLRDCKAEHVWIVPEPIGSDGQVHVCPHGGSQPEHVPDLFKVKLWKITEANGCESVPLMNGKESLITCEGVSVPGATFALSHDCGVSFSGGAISRTVLHAKAYTSADPSTWRLLHRKRLLLEIASVRDRDAFTFTVNFNGHPVANPRISIRGSDGFVREVQGNSAGQVTCSLPQSGLYGLVTTYIDERPGMPGDQGFVKTRHFSTLTLPVEVIPQGR